MTKVEKLKSAKLKLDVKVSRRIFLACCREERAKQEAAQKINQACQEFIHKLADTDCETAPMILVPGIAKKIGGVMLTTCLDARAHVEQWRVCWPCRARALVKRLLFLQSPPSHKSILTRHSIFSMTSENGVLQSPPSHKSLTIPNTQFSKAATLPTTNSPRLSGAARRNADAKAAFTSGASIIKAGRGHKHPSHATGPARLTGRAGLSAK
jgi:hypothetical protein